MARKKHNKYTKEPEKVTENYYDLKKDAVNRLVNADKKTYPKDKTDPGKKYRSGFLDRIPKWVLAVFMKFWFNGAVCFFILWGLGLYLTNMENMILVMAVVLGMVTDLLVNNAFRFFETYKGQNSKWMMFPQKKYWTFLANIPYAFVILVCVIWLYESINGVLNVMNATEGQVYLGVEPLMFGVFYMLVDLVFIGIKNTFVSIIKDAKEKSGVQNK